MSNPVFTNTREFVSPNSVSPVGFDAIGNPLDSNHEVMTYEGTTVKAAGLGLVVFALGAIGYLFTIPALAIAGAVIGLVLGLVISFKRVTSPALLGVYAVAQGYFLGAITYIIELNYRVPGAGLQALGATAVTFLVALYLYRSGRVRYTSKLRRVLLIGGISYGVFSLANLGYMLFSGSNAAFGLRTEISIAGIPLGVILGIVAVVLASISLIGNFDFIETGVVTRQSAQLEWRAAFGLIVTLIWLYIEFLRLIAIIMGRR